MVIGSVSTMAIGPDDGIDDARAARPQESGWTGLSMYTPGTQAVASHRPSATTARANQKAEHGASMIGVMPSRRAEFKATAGVLVIQAGQRRILGGSVFGAASWASADSRASP